MNLSKILTIGCAGALALGIGLQGSNARADIIQTKHQYTVKAICSLLGTFGDGALAQGTYRTLINVANPSDQPVKFAVKPIIAGTLGGPLDGIGGVVPKKDELPPHGAVSIACGTIAGFFCPTADGICFDFSAIEGFVKIQSTDKLEVVAVYTARPSNGEVSTIDVETVEGHEHAMEVDADDMDEPPAYEPRMRMRGAHDAE